MKRKNLVLAKFQQNSRTFAVCDWRSSVNKFHVEYCAVKWHEANDTHTYTARAATLNLTDCTAVEHLFSIVVFATDISWTCRNGTPTHRTRYLNEFIHALAERKETQKHTKYKLQ